MTTSATSAKYGTVDEYRNLFTAGTTTAKTNDEASTDETLLQKTYSWSFVAGVLYAIIIVCGIVSEMGLRGNLIDYSDFETTMANLQTSSSAALRWSVLLDLTMSVSDVALSILLGAVLIVNGADKLLTVMAMVFRIVQQAVLATNLLHLLVASLLLDPTVASAPVLAQAFGSDENRPVQAVESIAMLFLFVHKYGYAVALVFFSLSLALLGTVIWMSRIFPQWLGAATVLAGMGYLLDCICYFVVPGYTGDGTLNNVFMLPVFVAEFGLAGWLLARKPVPAH